MIIKTSKGDRKRTSLYMSSKLYSRIKKLKLDAKYSFNEKVNWILEDALQKLEEDRLKHEKRF